jgi:hypothetical protein
VPQTIALCNAYQQSKGNITNGKDVAQMPSPTIRPADPRRVAEILAAPTASITDAGYCLGLGRDNAYAAARKGKIKVIDLDYGQKRVPTSWLKQILGLTETGEAA